LQVSKTARLLIAGQAPGTRVHRSGRPFTDRSGDRLRAWMGVSPEQFYDAGRIAIVPMGFCFPGLTGEGADLPPRLECAPAWRRLLIDALPRMELVLAVGLYAQAWHMGSAAGRSLTDTVAAWREGLELDPPVIPLPHPSWRNSGWLKANPWFDEDVLPVLRARVARIIGP
jgi:uracil-DNA glycosylase